MADILIHGMGDTPVGQKFVIVENIDFERYLYNRETGAAFHLISLPEGHGRLGDLETAEAILHNKTFDLAGTSAEYNALNWALRQIKALPTIVPAEGG